jgi:hypothetical protein
MPGGRSTGSSCSAPGRTGGDLRRGFGVHPGRGPRRARQRRRS